LTGGTGLVGRTLAPLLRERYEVTHFDVSDPGDGLPAILGDLRSPSAVAAACRGMDAILHVAALHGQAWAAAGDDAGFAVNLAGTKNILEGAAAAGVKRVVFTSSIWATGHDAPPAPHLPIDEALAREPAELYGLTKILGEQMCRYATAKYGFSTIVLRPGGIRPAAGYAPLQTGFLVGAVDVRDVAQAQVLALAAAESLRHDVFIITADSPLCQVQPQAYRADPAGMLDRVVPGVAARVRDGKLQLPAAGEWYSVAKAKRVLGYQPQFGFCLE
jgi:nucleoside-diphosphate-sugar epimerase